MLVRNPSDVLEDMELPGPLTILPGDIRGLCGPEDGAPSTPSRRIGFGARAEEAAALHDADAERIWWLSR